MKEIHILETRLAAPDTEFCPQFVQAMANRMAVSFHKYGSVADFDGSPCDNAHLRLDKFYETGNTEFLVDAANFLMMEFMRDPDAFVATDSDQSPGRVRLDGSVDAAPNRVTA